MTGIDDSPFPDDASAANANPADEESIPITVTHRNIPYTFNFHPSSTIADLSALIETELSIPASTQKFLIAKLGLQKPPFKNPTLALSTLRHYKIQLLAPASSELASFQAAASLASRRAQSRAQALSQSHSRRSASTPRSSGGIHTISSSDDDSSYTFLTLRPLPFLPHPERSLSLLQRLKSDPGIRATMRKHKFTVSLLTEMEPLSNMSTTHEGTTRLLGLNRNKGEAIELRLRTDAHDGYRDYKTIRKTLCHELAHNIHSDHDRQFWDLCHTIEREVDAVSNSGRTIGEGGTFAPSRAGEYENNEEDGFEDHGGWEGGEFVVGVGSGGGGLAAQGLSRREILARAAEERLRRMNTETPDGGKPGSSAQ